jgi:hypoxanthine-DNA glycosylase
VVSLSNHERHSVTTSSRTRIHGLPPIGNTRARTLVLGSMPGDASLRARQYYAHPQNAFWRILGEILGIAGDARTLPYDGRLRMLRDAGIALWDVLASCHRPGSLDSDIAKDSLRANDFNAFFAKHARIERVLFNGATAQVCFRRHVEPTLQAHTMQFHRLPSTSPANASIPYPRKLAAWRDALEK